jgi:hypothetical protein
MWCNRIAAEISEGGYTEIRGFLDINDIVYSFC